MDMKQDRDLELINIQEQEEKKEKKGEKETRETSGRFGMGFFTGILLTVLVLIGGAWLYCRISGMSLVIGSNGGNTVANSAILDEAAISKIQELTSYVDLRYYEDYDEDALRNGMYAGLIAGLGDIYSVYYTAEEYANLQVSTSGVYYGIGAGLSQNPDTMEVKIGRAHV